jgi:uncharacterized BrkB/YihY/UPF0761 family membrane protein
LSSERAFKFDAAGWLFWTVVFVVLAAPCIFVCWRIMDPSVSRWYAIVTGSVLSAIGAGTISWAVNAVLQRRQKKQRMARRKKARKQK